MSKPGSLPDVIAAKRAVIFDLFHTLTARESTWGGGRPPTHAMLGVSAEAWNRQLLECSRERLTGQRKDVYGIIRDMAWAIDPSITEERVRAATDNRIARFEHALIHIPAENQTTVRALRRAGKKIGLVSNADVMEAAPWSRCPLRDQFDSVIFSCEAGCAKPDAEIYERALRELEVSPAEAIFVGDGGSNELAAAKALGITTVMVAGVIRELWPDKIAARAAQADFQIEELSELLELPGANAEQPGR